MNLLRANAFLAIAAAALAVPTWLTIQGDLENFVDTAQVPKLFEGFTADNVAAVALGKPKDPQPEVAQQPGADPDQKAPIQYDQIQFQRTDKGFVLGQAMGEKFGAPVNSQMLDLQVWKHLSSIQADRETLVQENATEQQLADYGLDPLHAFVIKAFNAQQQVIAELLVGKDPNVGAQGTDTVRGVYVRSRTRPARLPLFARRASRCGPPRLRLWARALRGRSKSRALCNASATCRRRTTCGRSLAHNSRSTVSTRRRSRFRLSTRRTART